MTSSAMRIAKLMEEEETQTYKFCLECGRLLEDNELNFCPEGECYGEVKDNS